MTAFYSELDTTIPTWPTIIRAPRFAEWVNRVDCEDGSCMCDRLQSLWGDPLDSADEFAALLRLFVKWDQQHHQPTGAVGWLKRLFRGQGSVASNMVLPLLSGKYELLRALGRGGCGEVYLAWSTETKSLYALKTIRIEQAQAPQARASFRHEAEAWIRLGEHPNIAKAYYFEEVGRSLYITMLFVEGDDSGSGPSLADKLIKGPVPPNNILPWFCQVADGLKHAYSNGVVAHRDIKPGNVLIGRNGVALISDFGMAVTKDDLFKLNIDLDMATGTPLYMSPEQFISASDCDQKSDIYSIGITLYEAVCGRPPFLPGWTPRSNAELNQYYSEIQHMHEVLVPQPLDSKLWPVIERCLQKSPKDRFLNITEFRGALEALGKHVGVPIPPPGKAKADFWALRDEGNSLMRLGRYEEAIKVFDSFLKILDIDESVILNRACCLESLGKYAEALEVFQALAKRGVTAGMINGSHCLHCLGRDDEALQYAKRAVTTNAQDTKCWVALGNAEYSFRNWGEAIRAYSQAQQLDPTDPTPAYNLGLAAVASESRELATRAMLTFLRVAPLDDPRRQYAEESLARIGVNA